MRRVLLVFGLILLTLSPAFAQGNGHGGGNGNGNGNSSGDSNGNGNGQSDRGSQDGERGNGAGSDRGNQGGNGQGNGGDKGAGGNQGGGNGKGGAGGNGQGNPDRPAPSGSGNGSTPAGLDTSNPTRYTQDDARDAVNAGLAVGLGTLLPDLQSRTAGEVIDAELLSVRGFLVYAVKVLRAQGQVTTEYYYAQSGRFIGSEP